MRPDLEFVNRQIGTTYRRGQSQGLDLTNRSWLYWLGVRNALDRNLVNQTLPVVKETEEYKMGYADYIDG